jgi:hypothetical protein
VTTPGNDPADEEQYDFWDHVDHAFDLAEERGMYIAMVPTWNRFPRGDLPPSPSQPSGQDGGREGDAAPGATLHTGNVARYTTVELASVPALRLAVRLPPP